MPLYSYRGVDAGGTEQRGQLEAENERAVVRQLRDRAIYVLKVQEGPMAGPWSSLLAGLGLVGGYLRPGRYAPVGSADLVLLFRQLALMLRAGYTLVTALEANLDMVPKMRLRRALRRMSDEIRRGSSFSAQLAREKGIFSPMIANLVASGEQSGNLDAILDRLADSLERSRELKFQLVSALVYPCFVLLVSMGVVAFLFFGVIPRFATFLSARKAALPASTQLLMKTSDWLVSYGGPLAAVLGLVVFAIMAAYTTRPGKRFLDGIVLRLPVVGSAVLFAAMAQSGWSLSMLLQSGVTVLGALRIVCGVVGNLAISDCFSRAAADLLEGRPLSKAFDKPHIPQMMRHMVAVGESSGQLDTVMDSVGQYYQKALAAKVKLISLLIEPVLIVFVGSIVGFVYFSFFQALVAVSKGGR